jgi:hypothetical protein
MEQVPTDKKQRMPSSRVLEEVIDQALFHCGLADVDLAAAFVRHRHAVSWIARDDTGRLHGARPYAGGHGSAVDCGPRRTCFPAFHHDATLADEASPAAWRARGLGHHSISLELTC